MQFALQAMNALAFVLVIGMTDLEIRTRTGLAALIALNLICVAGPNALTSRAARVGAIASLGGEIAAVALWIVLALGCGIEYFNPRCDALVNPLIKLAVCVGLTLLPIARAFGLISRSTEG